MFIHILQPFEIFDIKFKLQNLLNAILNNQPQKVKKRDCQPIEIIPTDLNYMLYSYSL